MCKRKHERNQTVCFPTVCFLHLADLAPLDRVNQLGAFFCAHVPTPTPVAAPQWRLVHTATLTPLVQTENMSTPAITLVLQDATDTTTKVNGTMTTFLRKWQVHSVWWGRQNARMSCSKIYSVQLFRSVQMIRADLEIRPPKVFRSTKVQAVCNDVDRAPRNTSDLGLELVSRVCKQSLWSNNS